MKTKELVGDALTFILCGIAIIGYFIYLDVCCPPNVADTFGKGIFGCLAILPVFIKKKKSK